MPEVKEDVLDPVAEEARKEYEAEKAEAEGTEPPKKEETPKEEEGKPKEEESKPKEEEPSKEKEPEPKSDEELLKAKDEELSEDELKVKQELVKAQEKEIEDVLLDKDEKDLSKEEKIEKADIIQRREDERKTAFDTDVKAYAAKKEIPEDEARKTLESADKLLGETFKGDAKELARTHIHLQRVFDKTQQELRNIKDAPPRPALTIEGTIKAIENGLVKVEGKSVKSAEVIETHRELNPEITKDMDDETVLKLVAKEMMAAIEYNQKSDKVKFSADAKDRRTQLLNTLKDTDKKFTPDIEAVVSKMSDYQIMGTQSLTDTILWAKGKNYDQDIAQAAKDAEERGFRRGQANRKVKTGPVGTGKTPVKTGIPSLSQAAQAEAWQMFPQAKDDKEAFSLYADVQASRKKK